MYNCICHTCALTIIDFTVMPLRFLKRRTAIAYLSHLSVAHCKGAWRCHLSAAMYSKQLGRIHA